MRVRPVDTRGRLAAAVAPLLLTATTAADAGAQTRGTAPRATPRRFLVAAEGNEARYRVRERLMNMELDNDAVGVTREIIGSLFVDAQGRVVRDSSRIIVSVASLKSDRDRRDNYLRRRTLLTDSFPTVTLVPTAIRGATGGLPTAGEATFELLGDLTIRGVTRPTVWKVTARADGGAVAGSAVTAFTFADFSLAQPRVPVVLSVADTIKLEYDFRFVADTARR